MTDPAARAAEPRERTRPLGLFEAYGVETEMMIVDAVTFDVKPVCDQLLALVAGEPTSDVVLGNVTWSNELTLHVLELKTTEPTSTFVGLARELHASLEAAVPALDLLGARLLPGAMHPWMDPHRETSLWPHENTEVYRAFDRIFGCSGHGWANLQSTHLNLPFADDEEFRRLHAAIRLVLPLVPGLAAGSPFQDGGVGPALDNRLAAYRQNSAKVPSVAGSVVPEPAANRQEYEREILGRIYADLAPHDPEGVLRHEWVNARGAIARFDRGAIEIRVIDAQECPTADLAVVAAIVEVVRALTEGRLAARDLARDPSTELLAQVFDRAVVDAERTTVVERELLRVLGVPKDEVTLRDLWARLLDTYPPDDPEHEWTAALQNVLDRGTLARRLLAISGSAPDRRALQRVAEALAVALAADQPLVAGERA